METADFNKFVEEVKAKNDIVGVINRYVPLEKKGKTYWGRCPFHTEKTPSFAVNETGQFYHCFGCKAGGDVIKFISEIESLSYMDSLAFLAERAGLEVPKFSAKSKDEIDELKKKKERLLEITKLAAKHYNDNLFEGKCPAAWKYLFEVRQVPKEVAIKFGMGASIDYQEMLNFLKSKGYSNEEIFEAGVSKCSETGRYYDAVAERLVFPNVDVYGNVIGFCGRILEPKGFAKYLNTAETMLFSKGKTLFGINLIKKKKQVEGINSIRFMIIVEGQMDTVSLHKAGFDTAVASMGTALTQDQAKLIKRFTDNVLICYDGDFAGQKATIRGLEILKEEGLNVKVVSLPEGMDPDDVINKRGKDEFVKLLREALPLLEFKFELLKKSNNLTTREGRTKYLNEAIEVLKGIPEVEREVYLSLVSEVSNTNIDFLKRQLSDLANESSEGSQETNGEKREVVKNIDSAIVKAEKFVLSAMINLKPFAYFEKDISYIFVDETLTKICEAISLARGSASVSQMIRRVTEYIGDGYESELSEVISYIDALGNEESDQKYFKDSLWIIYKNYLEKHLDELNSKLEKLSDNTERKQVLEEIMQTLNKIKLKKVDL